MMPNVLAYVESEMRRSIQVKGYLTRKPKRQVLILMKEMGELAEAVLDETRVDRREQGSELMHLGCVIEEAIQVASLASMIADKALDEYDSKHRAWSMTDHKSRMVRVDNGGDYVEHV